ncbi:E3 ubiquitin-protein ligase SH3RF1-like [Pristis pectinata]|uniref:E3 ubiquitin-protein ligase SH3RF1-like n=1 Tax=Pristis pectinata TaxID=685728 RepID=UPI00223D7CCD|nr:E3 ubiquitin-protein ligase SH3RF1-like [Pristis pectinata]
MDDLALLDLLECPVCFERLDATAKVLPCQHTFCKPCLHRIFNSRKELRCPECRTPVTCSIEELPVNLLLVRLLDGIKYGQSNGRVIPPQTAQDPANQDQGKRSTDPVNLHTSLVNTLPGVRSPTDKVPCARALYTYGGQKPGDLSFKKGDVILLRRQVDENWYYGEINGVCGIFPLNFVQVIHHLPQPPPLCKALYDFTLKEKEEEVNKDLLPFLKNDILKVIRRVDENWAEGKLGEKVGIFPISFVEMNSTAKQLLATRKPDVKSVKCQSSPSAANSNTTIRHTETGRTGPKENRCHTSAINMLNRISHMSPSHQPLQISSPVLISSSNPAVVAQIAERRTPCSPIAQTQHGPFEIGVAAPGTSDTSSQYHSEMVYLKPQVPTKGAKLEMRLFESAIIKPYKSSILCQSQRESRILYFQCRQQQIPPMVNARNIILFSFSIRRSEELEARKDEIFHLYGKPPDGWIRGMSVQISKTESLPSNYTVPISRNTCVVTEGKGSNGLPATTNTQERGAATDATLNSQTSPNGRRVAVTSPPVASGGTIARRIYGTSYRANAHRPTLAVPPVQSQSTNSRCVPAVVIQAQPFASHQLMQAVAARTGLSSAAARASRPSLPIRPMVNTASTTPPSGKASAAQIQETSSCNAAVRGCVPVSNFTPSHCQDEDRSSLNQAQTGLGASVPQCAASSTRPKFQAATKSVKPEQVTEEPVLQETLAPIVSHNRAGSCPTGTEEKVQMVHKKTGSWDSCYRCTPPSPLHSSAVEECPISSQTHSMCFNRCRAVLSYPAQGEVELGLEQGDIVLVHRKRQDGWFQGTHTESGKTGLFPGSFVESLQ